MRCMLVHPCYGFYSGNQGDFFTYLGARNILQNIYENIEFVHIDCPCLNLYPKEYFINYDYGEIDMVAIMGTTWIFANKELLMYDVLEGIRQAFPSSKFVALGIGQVSSFPFTEDDLDSVIKEGHGEHLRNFDLIITRDLLSHKILEDKGIESKYYYDISIFAYDFLTARINKNQCEKSPLLICALPNYPLEPQYQRLLHFIYAKCFDYWRQKNPRCITMDLGIRKLYKETFGIDAKYISDPLNLVDEYAKTSDMLSIRVHQSIIASMLGVDVSCIAIDSRYLTLMPFEANLITADGSDLWRPDGEIPKFEMDKLKDGTYISEIRQYFQKRGLL